MADLPVVLSKQGMQPIAPADLWAQLLADVAAIRPGYTANLPGGLIEDISSTDVAALALCDSARVELVNSLTPYGANAWLLRQLGAIYGVKIGDPVNTSVQVIFNGVPGYVIPAGFLVTDGVYYYAVKDGAVIGSSSQSGLVTCIATTSGAWEVPVGTVTELATSVPSNVTLTCSNPYAGTPGQLAESETSYRTRVLAAGLAMGLGMPAYIRTLVGNVPGVEQRLVSIQQQSGGGWKILVGGSADQYAVAYAIYQAMLDVSTLTGSTMLIANISAAPNGVVTTVLNHGFSNGDHPVATDVRGMAINGMPMTVTVIDDKHFQCGINTTVLGAYVGGGVLTPNNRNNVVAITDYPDVYSVTYISPPQQIVAITVTWNTIEANFINGAAVAQLGAPALAAYINSIVVGQPINLYELQTTFQGAVASVIDAQQLTRMVFAVSINGLGVSPEPGTGIIPTDPESYFYSPPDGSGITILQG
jgi:hypothetical protein